MCESVQKIGRQQNKTVFFENSLHFSPQTQSFFLSPFIRVLFIVLGDRVILIAQVVSLVGLLELIIAN